MGDERSVAEHERHRREAEARASKEAARAERAEAAAEQQRRRAQKRAEQDHAEREQQLRRDRDRDRRQARARARTAATLPATKAEPPSPPKPPVEHEAAAAEGAGPRHPSLKRPTAKVAAALLAVAALALGAGALLGLPLPIVGDSEGPIQAQPAGATELISISPGTPIGLTKGPYHPVVVEDPNYGEGPAKFGADRGGRKHEGQDVFARPGTPLVAVRDGVVVDGGGGRSFYSYGGGNTLVIYSPMDDRSYVYLHMLKPALVRAGERVKAGQLVGAVGCTGSCDGPHLHFEVRRGRAVFGPQKKAIDPLPLLKQWTVRPVG